MRLKQKKVSHFLRNRILVMTLTFTLLISCFISCILFFVYTKYMKSSLLQTTDMNMQFLSDSIDGNVENVIRLVRWSQNNSTISEYVESKDEDSLLSMRAFNRLTEEYNNNSVKNYMHRVAISNSSTERFIQIVPTTFSSIANIAKEAPELDYFDTLVNKKSIAFDTGYVNDPFYSGRNKLILPIIQPITNRYNSSDDGWILIELSEQFFTDSLRYYNLQADSHVYLTIDDHIYQMSSDGLLEIYPDYSMDSHSTEYALSENTYVDYVKNNQTGKISFIMTKKLSIDNCYISQTISQKELNSQRSLFVIFALIVILLVCVLGLTLFLLLSRTIQFPVRKLQDKLLLISKGDFTRDTSIEWNHELGDVGKGINDLSENIVTLMEHRVEDEKQKKDLEYKMLQSQINPHFLYNTLNSIKWMATIQGADGISEMTTALSRLLKSITKGTSLLIPLSEELNLLHDYFTIQQYRYAGTITLSIQVTSPELNQCQIIKFTLQPLVENAIFHGIEPKGSTGNISVTASFTDNHDVLIEVADDGVGMPDDLPEKLLNGSTEVKSEFFKEIGISNVNQRIKYQFGENYGISIETELGSYTKMKILLPFTQRDIV